MVQNQKLFVLSAEVIRSLILLALCQMPNFCCLIHRPSSHRLDDLSDLSPSNTNNAELDRLRRTQCNRKRNPDWNWLNACVGIVQGDANAVETYLSSGGDPTRQLTQMECAYLNRPSAFDVGYTLVHLAIR